MIAKTSSGAVAGIDGYGVDVEVDLAAGLPSFSIVGLPDAAVRESRERVSAALRNCGYKLPLRRLTVNLAPAGMKKAGSSFDLPIAIGILKASGQIAGDHIEDTLFMGELALDGRLNPVRGVLPVACFARDASFQRMVVPAGNMAETSLVPGLEVAACADLEEVARLLEGGGRTPGRRSGTDARGGLEGRPGPLNSSMDPGKRRAFSGLDYSQVAGHETAKRGLQIAAAGGHHLLMTGPPGSGKTMLARRLPSILPLLDREEALECAKIASVTGVDPVCAATVRPFRAPHHSASDAGLIGGGRYASPGEITLAHNGVLFLDELTEFRRNVLETLRQPVEEGRIVIARAGMKYRYPARFQLVAAMNPCPCGHFGSDGQCRCTPLQVRRYVAKVSGPLLDRIAIRLPVKAVPVEEIRTGTGEHSGGGARGPGSSPALREGVLRAVEMQKARYSGIADIRRNADLSLPMVRKYCAISAEAEERLDEAQRKCGFSARTRKNILVVSRTIADLEGASTVSVSHLSEAVVFRMPETLDGEGRRPSPVRS